MELIDLFKRRRTIRKFKQTLIPKRILKEIVDAARLAPTARNNQPLEFVVVTHQVESVFSFTTLADASRPTSPNETEKPTAFILILSNKSLANEYTPIDMGITAGTIVLSAWANGIASCMLGQLDREKIAKALNIPLEQYSIELAIALGYPAQKSVVEELKKDSKYFVDPKGVVHVPKRSIDEVLHEEKF